MDSSLDLPDKELLEEKLSKLSLISKSASQTFVRGKESIDLVSKECDRRFSDKLRNEFIRKTISSQKINPIKKFKAKNLFWSSMTRLENKRQKIEDREVISMSIDLSQEAQIELKLKKTEDRLRRFRLSKNISSEIEEMNFEDLVEEKFLLEQSLFDLDWNSESIDQLSKFQDYLKLKKRYNIIRFYLEGLNCENCGTKIYF